MRYLTLFLLCFTIISCNSDDDGVSNDSNSELFGIWKRDLNIGGIEGYMLFTLSVNHTYTTKFTRTGNFSGPCATDPYCNNDRSGTFSVVGNTLTIRNSETGEEDSDSFSVVNNYLYFGEVVYYRYN